MRSLALLIVALHVSSISAAAPMIALAQSPPAAYAAAMLGAVAMVALGISLLIIWLTTIWKQTDVV